MLFRFSPAFYTDLLSDTPFITTDRWSVDNAITYMDTHGIAAGVISVSGARGRLPSAHVHPGRFGNSPTF